MKSTHIWLLWIALATILLCNNLYARPSLPRATLQIRSEKNNRPAEDYPVCDTPAAQPRYIGMGTVSSDSASGFIEAATGVDGYLVVISTSNKPGFVPATGTTYTVGSTVGNSKVVKAGPGTSFIATGLSAGTDYHVYVFSMKSGCPGGPVYRCYNPATVLLHTP